MDGTAYTPIAIEDKVRELLAQRLGLPASRISLDATFFDDLGADSLDTIEFVMVLEEEYGLEISDADTEKLKRVGDVVTYIHQHLSA